MTMFKRGSRYLNCLMCGHKDFDLIIDNQTKCRALRCKGWDFIFKESEYFHPIPKSIPELSSEALLPTEKEGGRADGRI